MESKPAIEWKKYHKSLRQFVAARVQDPEEANDLVQEIYAKALHKLYTYNPQYAFSTWLFAIAEHSCIDHYRKALRRKKREEEYYNEPSPRETATVETPAVRFEPETARVLLERVPPKYKKIFKMRYMKRMKYKDIATTTHMPIGTVKTYLYRAKAAINKK